MANLTKVILFTLLFTSFIFTSLNPTPVYAHQNPQALTPQVLTAEGRIEGHRGPFPDYGGIIWLDGNSAILYTIVKGLIEGFGRIGQSKEPRDDLRGNCIYGTEDNMIRSPCIQATANLLDEKNQIVASSSTNENGDFRFYIPYGKTYYVQMVDRKGRTALLDKKVGRGNFVSLLLKP